MNGNWGNLYRHSIENADELKLTDFTSDRFPYFAISSDFRRIIFSRGSSYSEAVQITGFSDAQSALFDRKSPGIGAIVQRRAALE